MPFILPPTPIAAAISPFALSGVFDIEPSELRGLLLEAQFLYGSGGTTVDAYVQTTLDQGATWIDIRNFHFTTSALNQVVNHSSATVITTAAVPGDGALASNTSVDGIIGGQLRVKYKSAGTYAGLTSLAIYAGGLRLRAP